MGSIPGFHPYLLAETLASELDGVATKEASRLRRAHSEAGFDPISLPLPTSLLALGHTASPSDLSLLPSPNLIDAELNRLEIPLASSVQDRLDGSRRALRSIAALEPRGYPDEVAGDLLSRGLGVAVSALLRAEDLRRSKRLWNMAWKSIAASSRHWDVRAGLLRQKAELLKLEHREDRATKLLEDLCDIHEVQRDARLYALATIKLTTFYAPRSNAERALDYLRIATETLHPENDRVEFLGALYSIARINDDLERYDEVRECLRRIGELMATARPAPPMLYASILWLSGSQTLRAKLFAAAEEVLRDAQILFLAQGEIKSSCRVSLELGLAVFEQGRTDEVRTLLAPTVKLLRFIDCPEEQLAAVILLNKAARAGKLRAGHFWTAIRSLRARTSRA